MLRLLHWIQSEEFACQQCYYGWCFSTLRSPYDSGNSETFHFISIFVGRLLLTGLFVQCFILSALNCFLEMPNDCSFWLTWLLIWQQHRCWQKKLRFWLLKIPYDLTMWPAIIIRMAFTSWHLLSVEACSLLVPLFGITSAVFNCKLSAMNWIVTHLFHDPMRRCVFLCCSVGYPVVTMGFSIKSCISYRFRLVSNAFRCFWFCLCSAALWKFRNHFVIPFGHKKLQLKK